MTALLRPYDERDLVGLVHLETLVDQACWKSSVIHGIHVSEPERTHKILVAERNGVLAGCLFASTHECSVFQSPVCAPGHVYIGWLAVHPDYQRQGIGTQLLREVRDDFRAAAQATAQAAAQDLRCWLHAHTENAPALALYAKHGFEQQERVEHYYGDDEHAYLMAADWPCAATRAPKKEVDAHAAPQ